jgi:hypothetical protein
VRCMPIEPSIAPWSESIEKTECPLNPIKGGMRQGVSRLQLELRA